MENAMSALSKMALMIGLASSASYPIANSTDLGTEVPWSSLVESQFDGQSSSSDRVFSVIGHFNAALDVVDYLTSPEKTLLSTASTATIIPGYTPECLKGLFTSDEQGVKENKGESAFWAICEQGSALLHTPAVLFLSKSYQFGRLARRLYPHYNR